MSEELTPHERRMQRRINFIESNPMAVSPQERSLLLGRRRQMEDEDRLRKHEMEMLDKRNAGQLDVAKANAEGLMNQGRGAAEVRAEADKALAGINADNQFKIKQMELDAQESIEREKNHLERARLDHEYKKAQDHNATAKDLAHIQGGYAVKTATEQAKGGIAREEIRRDIKREEFKNKLDVKDRDNQGKLGAEKIKTFRSIIENFQEQNPDMTQDQVFEKMREMYKTDPDMMLYLGGSASVGQPGDKYKRK